VSRTVYPNAPITEATISLGIVPPADLDVDDLRTIQGIVKDQYPQVGEDYLYSGEVSIDQPGDAPEHSDTHEHIGYAFRSEDGQRTFGASLDGFNFTVTQPYDSWEVFRDEARHLWDLYKEVSGVEEIVRVAVRYINRIDIPIVPEVKIDRYLKVYPEVPDGWPSGVTVHNFFMQVQAWQEDLDSNLIVNVAPGRPPGPGITSVRLDIDLFSERFGASWRVDREKEVWEFLEQLRERKNEIFETSITDDTRELIS
jgi:uncharacterized protein (TIGR04255 family)